MDSAAHRHPRAAHRGSGRGDVGHRRAGGAAARSRGRPHARRHRVHRRRHHHTGHDFSEHGVHAAGQDRRDERVGLRSRRRLLRIHLRAEQSRISRSRPAPAEHALVVGADVMSSIIDYTDRATCVLFGDGAGAAVVSPAAPGEPAIIDFLHITDGTGGPALCMPAGGSRQPASHETVDQRLHYVKQDGATVFKFAVKMTEEISRRILERNGLTAHDLDLFVSHQANRRIIEAGTQRLGLPPRRKSSSTSSGTATRPPARFRSRSPTPAQGRSPEERRSRAARVGRRRVHGRIGAPQVESADADRPRIDRQA